MDNRTHPGDGRGYAFPAWIASLVLGFHSGMFTAIATGYYSTPTIGPSVAAGFAVVTAAAAVFLGVVTDA